jgi:hypothetical protein
MNEKLERVNKLLSENLLDRNNNKITVTPIVGDTVKVEDQWEWGQLNIDKLIADLESPSFDLENFWNSLQTFPKESKRIKVKKSR